MMNYKGIIALILATSMGLGWIIVLSAISYWHQPLGEKGAAVLESVGIGMVSIVSFYIGRQTGSDK